MSIWVDENLKTLDLRGRDRFYTDLLMQEIPFWWRTILNGKVIEESEVVWLAERRGFNASEQVKLRRLAAFFNDNAEKIRAER